MSLAWPTRGPVFVHPEWFPGLTELESGRLARFLSFSVRQYALDGLDGARLASAAYWVAGAVLRDTKTDLAGKS